MTLKLGEPGVLPILGILPTSTTRSCSGYTLQTRLPVKRWGGGPKGGARTTDPQKVRVRHRAGSVGGSGLTGPSHQPAVLGDPTELTPAGLPRAFESTLRCPGTWLQPGAPPQRAAPPLRPTTCLCPRQHTQVSPTETPLSPCFRAPSPQQVPGESSEPPAPAAPTSQAGSGFGSSTRMPPLPRSALHWSSSSLPGSRSLFRRRAVIPGGPPGSTLGLLPILSSSSQD